MSEIPSFFCFRTDFVSLTCSLQANITLHHPTIKETAKKHLNVVVLLKELPLGRMDLRCGPYFLDDLERCKTKPTFSSYQVFKYHGAKSPAFLPMYGSIKPTLHLQFAFGQATHGQGDQLSHKHQTAFAEPQKLHQHRYLKTNNNKHIAS